MPSTGAARTATEDLRRLLPPVRVRRLGNGLTLCTLASRRVPLVASALIYRAGARDEEPGLGGTAHFLEHMMFKGSRDYGPGEIDRLTRSLGGSNNAFTTHDSTLYYFTFAADRWRRSLAVEADRMAGLRLDAEEVTSERQVILEEIAMYEGEPWDALDRRVTADFHREHPYGRPVLGTRDELRRIDGGVLAAFHRRYYRPGNAILVLAGDLDDGVDEAVEAAFGALPGGEVTRPSIAAGVPPRRLRRIERRQGEVARLLLSLPAPAGGERDHPLLSLLVSVLGSGRASRLHRELVDEGQLCVWVATDLHETIDPGSFNIALEVVPGVEPGRVEEELLRQIERLRTDGPTAEEVARAKKIVLADWIFGHEPIQQQAFLLASALALFDDTHPWRYLERLLAADRDELRRVARHALRPAAGGVLGWSLPQR